MVLGQRARLHTNMGKTKPRSRLWTLVRCLNPGRIIVLAPLVAAGRPPNEGDEASFRSLVGGALPEEARRDAGDKDLGGGDLAGKIMINRRDFGMRVFRLSLSGSC